MVHSDHKRYVEANEKAWDEVVPIHQSYRSRQVDFFRKGGSTLDRYELENLPDLKGKHVAHLCCNCGQDTLSLAGLGANCTGFDQSGIAIAEAKKLSKETGIRAEFVRANVLDIPDVYSGKFDLVYMSIGVLVWIPDINLLIRNSSKLLRPGGELFIYDQHPFSLIFDQFSDDPDVIKFDYFYTDPTEYRGLDYLGGEKYDASPNYQYMVRLSDILNGIAECNLQLIKFLEFRHSIEDARPGKEIGRNPERQIPVSSYSKDSPNMFLLRAKSEGPR